MSCHNVRGHMSTYLHMTWFTDENDSLTNNCVTCSHDFGQLHLKGQERQTIYWSATENVGVFYHGMLKEMVKFSWEIAWWKSFF